MYTPGSSRVKTHTLDKELTSANTKEDVIAELYHSISPDTSLAKGTDSRMYTDYPLDHVYQYAGAGQQCHYDSESTTCAAQVSNT